MPEVKVVAVADLNAASAQLVAHGLGAEVADAKSIIDRCPWIVIATPPEAHFQLSLAAVAAGKRGVIVEKPFVVSVDQATRVLRAAEESESHVYAAQFRRSFPSTILSRDLVAGGVVGPVTGVEVFEGGRFAWETKSDYVSKSAYGGVLFDTGSHSVDQVLYIAGLENVDAEVTIHKVDRDRPEPSHQISASFSISKREGSIVGSLKLSRAQPLANVVRVYGRDGIVECDVSFSGQVRLFRGGKRILLAPPRPMPIYVDAFVAEYRDIFRKGPAGAFTGASTLLQLKILEGIHRHGH